MLQVKARDSEKSEDSCAKMQYYTQFDRFAPKLMTQMLESLCPVSFLITPLHMWFSLGPIIDRPGSSSAFVSEVKYAQEECNLHHTLLSLHSFS